MKKERLLELAGLQEQRDPFEAKGIDVKSMMDKLAKKYVGEISEITESSWKDLSPEEQTEIGSLRVYIQQNALEDEWIKEEMSTLENEFMAALHRQLKKL